MLTTIIRKEVAHQIITTKFAVMLLLVFLLSIISTLVMVQDYQLRVENYETLKPTGQDTVAMKAPDPMSILVRGLDERMGRSIEVDTLGQFEVGSSQSAANRLFALFRQIDMHFVAIVILSLAAILFSFDMISGEKRTGTLKLNLANSVSRNKLVLGKWLAATFVVTVPLLVAFIIAVLMISFMVPEAVSGDFYFRTASLFLVTLLYLLVFVSLGLLISTLTNRPSVSLVFSLLVWALVVFVAPGVVAQMAQNSVSGETVNELERRTRSVWFKEVFLNIRGDYRDRDEGFFYKHVSGEMANYYREYLNLTRNRLDNLKTYSLVSPTGAYNFLAWGVARTGPYDSLKFKEDVLRYQPVAVADAGEYFKVRRNQPGANPDYKGQIFTFHSRDLSAVIENEGVLSFVVLIFVTIVLYMVTFFAFIKYDVR